jgi:hypothetical protein
MVIRTASHISTSSVTDAQIGACHKVFSGATAFYMVESASDPDREYKVSWTREHGFQCQCKAAEYGNLCWHIRASIAAAREEREAVAELNRAIAEQAAKPVASTAPELDTATRARIEAANERQAGKVSRAKARDSKPFSLLR